MEDVVEPSAVEETQESTGLLDGATPDIEEGDKEQVEMDHRDPEEVKAEKEAAGEEEDKVKPKWLPDNFWKKDKGEGDYEAMAKSYNHYKKLVSQGKHKAPKDGVYDASAFGNTPEDDPVRGHVMDWAKENGISQAALDQLVGQVVEMGQNEAEVERLNVEEEHKALGPNADARINSMKKWASGLVNKGIWGKDDFEEFTVWGGTAKGLFALEKLISTYEGRIPVEASPVDGAPSDEEVLQMVSDPKYQTDPAYRAKVERAFNQQFK